MCIRHNQNKPGNVNLTVKTWSKEWVGKSHSKIAVSPHRLPPHVMFGGTSRVSSMSSRLEWDMTGHNLVYSLDMCVYITWRISRLSVDITWYHLRMYKNHFIQHFDAKLAILYHFAQRLEWIPCIQTVDLWLRRPTRTSSPGVNSK